MKKIIIVLCILSVVGVCFGQESAIKEADKEIRLKSAIIKYNPNTTYIQIIGKEENINNNIFNGFLIEILDNKIRISNASDVTIIDSNGKIHSSIMETSLSILYSRGSNSFNVNLIDTKERKRDIVKPTTNK